MEHPLLRAAKAVGSQSALAALLGVSKSALNQWLDESRRIPAEHCPAIERATRERGKPVLCEELRPDIAWSVLRLQAGPVAGEPQQQPEAV